MPAACRAARFLAAAMLACALAGCAGQPASAPSAQSSSTPSSASSNSPELGGESRLQTTWMLTKSALSQMLADDASSVIGVQMDGSGQIGAITGTGKSMSGSAMLRLTLFAANTVLQPGQQPLNGVDATPVVSFSSVATLRSTLDGNGLPAGTQAVLYDPEVWAYTPAAEQRDPVLAAAQAAEMARSHGLQIIVAPAMNLTSALDPGSSAPRWQTLLDLHIIGPMARAADTVELQAQSLERDPAAYAAFVREAAAQARAANPKVTVLAGLSTNPPGAAVDSQQLTAAIQASQADVDGYWLNIPGSGPRCPGCNAGQPELGAAVLSDSL